MHGVVPLRKPGTIAPPAGTTASIRPPNASTARTVSSMAAESPLCPVMPRRMVRLLSRPAPGQAAVGPMGTIVARECRGFEGLWPWA